MIDLNDYFYFVHVVEKQGFSAAARALNIPKSRISRHINQLEQRLDARLIHRTSRNMSVTETGQTFYQHARSLIDAMELAEASVQQQYEKVSGRIVLSCSVGVAQFVLMNLVSRFVLENPNIDIDQHVSNDIIDLIEQGVDIAVRGHTSDLPDSSLIQRPLATVEWQLFAGHSFVDQYGMPNSPYDLKECDFLKVGWRQRNSNLLLQNKEGIKINLSIAAKFCSDDMTTLKHAAEQGLGIVALPAYTCRAELASGQLLRVLPEWSVGEAKLSVLMPSRLGVPPHIKAFSEFLRKEVPRVVATL